MHRLLFLFSWVAPRVAVGTAMLFMVAAGCVAEEPPDDDGMASGGDATSSGGGEMAAPGPCGAWSTWSCYEAEGYCFADCGGAWMKCYPGSSYPCYFGVPGSQGSCARPLGLGCEACAENFSSCVAPEL